MITLAIDSATTAGLAWTYGDRGKVYTATVKGTPLEQWTKIKELIGDERIAKVIIEKLVYFRNGNTSRSLSERIGFLRWKFVEEFGVEPIFLAPNEVRSALKLRGKKGVLAHFRKFNRRLTDDETDALALLAANGIINKTRLNITRRGKL